MGSHDGFRTYPKTGTAKDFMGKVPVPLTEPSFSVTMSARRQGKARKESEDSQPEIALTRDHEPLAGGVWLYERGCPFPGL